MKEQELRSAVTPDADPYLEAHAAHERALTAKQRSWNGLPYEDNLGLGQNDWRSNDSHLSALAGRKGESTILDRATVEVLRLDADERIGTWRKNRDRAGREVKMLERLGEPVPDELRAEAEAPDHGQAVDDAAEAMKQRSKRVFHRVLSGQS